MSPDDTRARILARCDELERLARDAESMAGGVARWLPTLATPGEGAAVVIRPVLDVLPPSASPNRLVMGEVLATCPIGAVGRLLGAFDPAAVAGLAAGAREVCEGHRPSEWDAHHCRGCGLDRTGEPLSSPDECPTLAALARMLGVVLGYEDSEGSR